MERRTQNWAAATKRARKLRKFTIFSNLPPELRRMIWTLALPGPRVVEIRSRLKFQPTSTGKMLSSSRFSSLTKYPVILRVCRESRMVAWQHYKLSFAWGKRPWQPARIYIDFSVDTVWFDHLPYFPVPSEATPPVHADEFSKIRCLATRHGVKLFLQGPPMITPKYFSSLEVIKLVSPRCRMKRSTYSLIPDGNPNQRGYDIKLVEDKVKSLWKSEKRCPAIECVEAVQN